MSDKTKSAEENIPSKDIPYETGSPVDQQAELDKAFPERKLAREAEAAAAKAAEKPAEPQPAAKRK